MKPKEKDTLLSTAAAALDAGLQTALKQNGSATYYCAGSLPLSSRLDLYFTDSSGGAQRNSSVWRQLVC